MADKLTQAVLDGLTRAAAEPGGLPLFAVRAEPGLFPTAAAVRPAAQKCLAEGYLRVVRTEARGKSTCECYALTDAGWEHLLAQVNPKQVLEDFVRVLESRRGEVDGLLAVAARMADGLDGLRDAVARVLPQIVSGKLRKPTEPAAPPVAPRLREDAPPFHPSNGTHAMNGVAALEAPARAVVRVAADELAGAVLARLADWAASAAVGQDCPLPELFLSLGTREPAPTVGEFHDCLRALQSTGRVYLHPWTGPLYALPEPTFALLVGHGIAYYASVGKG